jgi:phosphonate transport system substrate-binding protein
VSAYADPATIILDERQATSGEEYLILVDAQSNIRDLADLRGRSLAFHRNPTTCLAEAWLRAVLNVKDAGAMQDFFGKVIASDKISKGVVLPVFFGQMDACLVTRAGFETLCELNPQLGRRLRVLAASPRVVTVLMAFHKDCPPEAKRRVTEALLSLHKSVPGQQVMTLFQTRRMVLRDIAALQGSIQLLHAAERVKAREAGGKR